MANNLSCEPLPLPHVVIVDIVNQLEYPPE